MHIVFLADPIDNQNGGIHYYCLNSLKAIIEKTTTHHITIIKETSTSFHLKANILALKRNHGLIREFWSIPRAIKKLNPDIVIEMAHFGPFNIPKKIKRITIIHDLTPILFPKWHTFQSPHTHRIFLPHILKKADQIITPSLSTKKDLIDYLPPTKDKTKVVPLGAEDIFIPTTDKDIIKKYKLEKPYFLHTGTFEPRKNHLTLLDAYQLYRENGGRTTSLILTGGTGWKSKKIHQAIKTHPYKDEIKILGFVDRQDLPTILSQAHGFIFPSLYEGFGLPLLEAMKCGAPSITAENSSLTEVGGSAALYFKTTDSTDLASKMEYLDDPLIRTSLKTASLQQAKNFSWERHAEKFLELIEKTCK